MSETYKTMLQATRLLLKRLDETVPQSSNAAEYARFRSRLYAQLRTFDPEDKEHYVDYVAKSMKHRQQQQQEQEQLPEKQARKKNVDEEAKKTTKKRSEPSTKTEADPTKSKKQKRVTTFDDVD
jgi:hypothetical protein